MAATAASDGHPPPDGIARSDYSHSTSGGDGEVTFVPCPLERIPASALAEYRQIYADIGSGGGTAGAPDDAQPDELLGADVRAAFRVNRIDVTAKELSVLIDAMERESGGGGEPLPSVGSGGQCAVGSISSGTVITFPAFAGCLHALVIQHREVGDATLYAVFPDSDFTAETATGLLRARRRVWALLDEPSSSTAARCVSLFLVAAILLSTAAFICETYPLLRRDGDFRALDAIEAACVAVFTLEVLLRVSCTPDPGHYFAK